MKKGILHLLTLIGVFLCTSAFVVKIVNSGIAGVTGSPGESTCNACHGANAAISSTSISSLPSFVTNQYIPGQTYTIQVNVSSPTLLNFGFGCEILDNSNINAGVMQNAGAGVKFLNASNGRKNAVHTTKKSGSGTATFTFEWVAPLTGNVKIFAVGNAVNSNGSTSGDAVSTNSLALSPNTAATGIVENQSIITGIQIYPNPINSDSKVMYTIIESGRVNIGLYDMQGKKVSDLVDENQAVGAYKINLNELEGLNKGVYFLKFSHNENKIKPRLIIVQ